MTAVLGLRVVMGTVTAAGCERGEMSGLRQPSGAVSMVNEDVVGPFLAEEMECEEESSVQINSVTP